MDHLSSEVVNVFLWGNYCGRTQKGKEREKRIRVLMENPRGKKSDLLFQKVKRAKFKRLQTHIFHVDYF